MTGNPKTITCSSFKGQRHEKREKKTGLYKCLFIQTTENTVASEHLADNFLNISPTYLTVKKTCLHQEEKYYFNLYYKRTKRRYFKRLNCFWTYIPWQ